MIDEDEDESLVSFAKREFDLDRDDSNEYAKLIEKAVMELLEVFENQNHSGLSASITLQLFNRLGQYLPISPLTGKDDEWNIIETSASKEVKNAFISSYRNKRCGTVYRDIVWREDGAPNYISTLSDTSYNIEGKIFSDNNGKSWYTCKDSRVDITFPYIPPASPEQVMVDAEN